MRRRAFIVKPERAESAQKRRVGGDVHEVRPVAVGAQPGQLEVGCPGERGLPTEDAVEFDRMADALVNLKAELGALEDQGALTLLQDRCRQQRHGLLRDTAGVAREIPLADDLEPAGLILPDRLGERPALRLGLADCRGIEAAAGLDKVLVNTVTLRRHEPLVGVPKRQVGRGKGDTVDRLNGRGDPKKKIHLLAQSHCEGVFGMGCLI